MMSDNRINNLERLMADFCSGKANSIRDANRIESELLELFPDDEWMQELADDLALYHPAGLDLLTPFEEMRTRMREAYKRLGGMIKGTQNKDGSANG